jgi:DnaJ family protein B protein 4
MVRETKLYDLLGVSPSASDAEIKKGYRKQALKYHPDKPTGDTEKFKEISEAFDILSNGDKRQVYDDYGLEAARGNAPAGGMGGNPFGGMGGGGGHSFNFSSGGHGFSQADAFNIFSQMGGFGMGGGSTDDFGFGGSPFAGMAGGMPGGFGGLARSARRPEPDTVTMPLAVTLEDIYNGATKKMKLNRKDMSGARESKVLEVSIKPGWKAGTKITFANEGDYQPEAGQRQTIQFVLEEKPHPIFKRDGNNLKMNLPLSFKESLTGFSKEVTTIDGRRIPFTRSQPVQPNTSTTYPGLGMPISKSPGQRGDLEITFKVDYPISLTPEQKHAIETLF